MQVSVNVPCAKEFGDSAPIEKFGQGESWTSVLRNCGVDCSGEWTVLFVFLSCFEECVIIILYV